jgi:hypothetical protein
MLSLRSRPSLLFVIAVLIAACTDPALVLEATETPVVARGSRTLGMDLGAADGESFDTAVARAKAQGVTTAVLNYDWSQLEPRPFEYQAAKLLADNAYYSTAPHAMSVVLNLRPIAGPCRVVPPDLVGLAWNDPIMIARFSYLLTWIRGHLPNVTVRLMSIGTEIDSHLSPAEYATYKTFFEAARQNAKARWGAQLPVGTAVTWDGLVGTKQAAILDLNERADHILFTYYGLTHGPGGFAVKDPYAATVADIFTALWAIDSNLKTRGRPLSLIEAGYPSSAALGGTLAMQQAFVSTIFGVWDAYFPRIDTVVFNWQTDLSEYGAQIVSIGDWGGGGCQAPAGAPPPKPATPTVTAQGGTGTRTWQYYVVATNGSGRSVPSDLATIGNGVAALSTSAYHRVTWAPVAGATGYKIMRYASGGTPATTGLIATVGASTTSIDDTGLASSTYNLQEFLRTLGLRTNTSPVVDKPAFVQIGLEAHARGW